MKRQQREARWATRPSTPTPGTSPKPASATRSTGSARSASTPSRSPAATTPASFCGRTARRQGLFSRGRHRLFQGRSRALRRDQAGRAFDAGRSRHAARARRSGSSGDQRLVGPAAQHPARAAPSGVDRRQRVRRPLRLQPLPLGARRARLRDRPRARRDRRPIRSAASRWRRRVSCPMRMAFITSSRSTGPNRWLDSQLGLCFCPHCQAGAKRAGIRVEALRKPGRGSDIEAYLASDVDFPADMARGVLARRHARRRRAARRSSTGAARS